MSIAAGMKILAEWLGDGGKPVPIEQAQARANVCLRCPRNYKGSWAYSMATQIAINAQMTLRRTMGIKLENEDQLRICELCGCQMRLKVHVPFRHIYAHTTLEQFAKLPKECWQLTEKDQLTDPNKK